MPIALLFGLVAMAILMPTLFNMAQQNQQVVLTSSAGQQLQAIAQAANQYVSDNYQSLVGTTSSTAPTPITLATLTAGGYLPPGFGATNAYGQSWQIQALQPASGQLQILVVSTGGQTLDAKTASAIAQRAGSQGGVIGGGAGSTAVPGCAAGTACGAYGGWSVNTANYTGVAPGHVAALLAFNSGGMLQNDYLYRVAIPGHPELNQMQANLDMGANTINNAGTVNANNNINAGTAGTPETGACAQDADGHCVGQIAAAGQSETSLPSNWWGGLISRDVWGTGTIAAGTGGVVQASMNAQGQITGSSSIAIGSGFTANSAGNANLTSQLVLGTAAGAAVGNSCPNNGALAANSNGSGQILNCMGNIWLAAGLPLGVNGQSCPSQGGFGQDANGNGIICQGGIWMPVQARMGGMVAESSYGVNNGSPIPIPPCPSGATPHVVLAPSNWSTGSSVNQAWSFRATPPSGGQWLAALTDGSGFALPTPSSGYTAIATTYCQF